jgi:hypothetical protein
MQTRPICFIGLVSLMLLLGSCSLHTTHANRADASAYLDKPMQLHQDSLLAETKHWNPSNTGRYWVFSFAEKPYHTNYINATIPSAEQYRQHPQHWQKWQGDTLAGWSRYVGMLSQGTSFHITDIVPKGGNNGYWVIIELDSGEHKGKSAIYANSRGLIPGMYS